MAASVSLIELLKIRYQKAKSNKGMVQITAFNSLVTNEQLKRIWNIRHFFCITLRFKKHVIDCSYILRLRDFKCSLIHKISLVLLGKFNHILFVTFSKTPNFKVIMESPFELCGKVPEFHGDEEAAKELGLLLSKISGSPILLVLDDVWPGSESLIQNFKFQIPHYKILITSKVAFPTIKPQIHLEPLRYEDAVTLFHHVTKDNGSYIPNEILVEEVVRSCKGLPLAIKVIARSLCQQPYETWQKMVEEWSQGHSILDSNSSFLNFLQGSLRLLEGEPIIKECFKDIGLFPEDQKIPATALIDMWAELNKLGDDGKEAMNIINKLVFRNLANLLVTSTGIGESIVRLFHLHGAKVCLVDVQDNLGLQVAESLGGNSNVCFFHCDVTVEDDVRSAVDFTVEKFGTLDIIVNNAGIAGSPCPDIRNADMSEFERVFNINVKGVFHGMKHAARIMIPLKKGSIISLSSVSSTIWGLGPHAYTGSKHAIWGLTKNVAAELGQHGIRVNCVAPYAVFTSLSLAHLPDEERTDEAIVGFRNFIGGNAKLQLVELTANDVANALLFLASDGSGYASGQNLMVDGGFTSVNHSLRVFR